jgi:hypothetical protein
MIPLIWSSAVVPLSFLGKANQMAYVAYACSLLRALYNDGRLVYESHGNANRTPRWRIRAMLSCNTARKIVDTASKASLPLKIQPETGPQATVVDN